MKTTNKKEHDSEGLKSETVHGITFYEVGHSKLITEPLGIDEDKFVDMAHHMVHAFMRDYEYHETDGALESFKNFLESKRFEKIGYKLEHPNDYLMLGVAFGFALNRMNDANALEDEAEDKNPLTRDDLPSGGFMKVGGKSIKMDADKARKLLAVLKEIAE